MISSLPDKEVKTRKEHECFECRSTIPVGTLCIAWACSDGGDFWSGWTHKDCLRVSELYRNEMRLWGEEWFGLAETAAQCGEQANDIRLICEEHGYIAVYERLFGKAVWVDAEPTGNAKEAR